MREIHRFKPFKANTVLCVPEDGVVIEIESHAQQRMVADNFQSLQILCDPLIHVVRAAHTILKDSRIKQFTEDCEKQESHKNIVPAPAGN